MSEFKEKTTAEVVSKVRIDLATEKQIALALMKRTGHLKTQPDGSAIFDTRVLNRTLKLLKEKV